MVLEQMCAWVMYGHMVALFHIPRCKSMIKFGSLRSTTEEDRVHRPSPAEDRGDGRREESGFPRGESEEFPEQPRPEEDHAGHDGEAGPPART